MFRMPAGPSSDNLKSIPDMKNVPTSLWLRCQHQLAKLPGVLNGWLIALRLNQQEGV